MKKVLILLNLFLVIIFINLLLVSPVMASRYYIFNAKGRFLNVMGYQAYPSWGFNWTQPPPGKTYDQLKTDYDTLVFLASLQGIVNRHRPNLYIFLNSSLKSLTLPGADERWKNIFSDPSINIWPWMKNGAGTPQTLSNLNAVINQFKEGYDIRGSVVWGEDKPYTLNLAATIAGAENYVIVRQGSSIASQITAAFPIAVDLTTYTQFTSKKTAYTWLVNNYLNTGKVNPILVASTDGYPVKRYSESPPRMFEAYTKQGGTKPNDKCLTLGTGEFLCPILSDGWGVSGLDIAISKKAFVYDLSPNPRIRGRDEPNQPLGEDRQTLQLIVNAARNIVGNDQILEFWGWYGNEKYAHTYANGGHCPNEHPWWGDGTLCLESEIQYFISQNGGVLRMGGGNAFGVEFPNASFYQHGPGVDFIPQNSPLTPQQLLQKNYVLGYPKNFSFERASPPDFTNPRRAYGEIEDWSLNDRVGIAASGSGAHGDKFLRIWVENQNPGTLNSFSQDINLNLLRGYRYSFSIKAKRPSGNTLNFTQAIWGWDASNRDSLLGSCSHQITSNVWTEKVCDVDVRVDGIVRVRLEVYLNSFNPTNPHSFDYDFDEAYFLGPNTLIINPNKKFTYHYMGDYDLAVGAYTALHLTGADVGHPWLDASPYLPIWENRNYNQTPRGWGLSSTINKEIPPIFSYLVQTKNQGDWFIMPDSGAGYNSPGSLADSFMDPWIKESTNLHRQLGYKTGWTIAGFNNFADLDKRDKVRGMYKVIAPEGIIYDHGFHQPDYFEEGLPILPLSDGGWMGLNEDHVRGKWTNSIIDAKSRYVREGWQDLMTKEDFMNVCMWGGDAGGFWCRTKPNPNPLGIPCPGYYICWDEYARENVGYINKFAPFRSVFVSPKLLDVAYFGPDTGSPLRLGIQKVIEDVEIVDPITFFYLYRLSRNSPTVGRASIVNHTLPTFMVQGRQYNNVTITLRNDGWNIWVPQQAGVSCNGAGVGHACERFTYGLKPGEISPAGLGAPSSQIGGNYTDSVALSKAVYPGEEITFNFRLIAPTTAGKYSFQADLVKEMVYFFETQGNVPWQKIIHVVEGNADFNNDKLVNFEDIENLVLRYNQSSPTMDLNSDGKVNSIDYVKALNIKDGIQ